MIAQHLVPVTTTLQARKLLTLAGIEPVGKLAAVEAVAERNDAAWEGIDAGGEAA